MLLFNMKILNKRHVLPYCFLKSSKIWHSHHCSTVHGPKRPGFHYSYIYVLKSHMENRSSQFPFCKLRVLGFRSSQKLFPINLDRVVTINVSEPHLLMWCFSSFLIVQPLTANEERKVFRLHVHQSTPFIIMCMMYLLLVSKLGAGNLFHEATRKATCDIYGPHTASCWGCSSGK